MSQYPIFENADDIERDIQNFANKHRIIIYKNSKRMSILFEISCYNKIVSFYEENGYSLKPCNIINGNYKYKCSPAGIQSNFSHFEAIISIDGQTYSYEIHHNLAVQSSHKKNLFATPDIAIVEKGKIKETRNYYESKRRFSYISNEDLISFCEAKLITPFPELLFSFIGILNELKKEHLSGEIKSHICTHIAPSLLISGKPNKQCLNIKKELETRYRINVTFDLLNRGKTLSKVLRILPVNSKLRENSLDVTDTFELDNIIEL